MMVRIRDRDICYNKWLVVLDVIPRIWLSIGFVNVTGWQPSNGLVFLFKHHVMKAYGGADVVPVRATSS